MTSRVGPDDIVDVARRRVASGGRTLGLRTFAKRVAPPVRTVSVTETPCKNVDGWDRTVHEYCTSYQDSGVSSGGTRLSAGVQVSIHGSTRAQMRRAHRSVRARVDAESRRGGAAARGARRGRGRALARCVDAGRKDGGGREDIARCDSGVVHVAVSARDVVVSWTRCGCREGCEDVGCRRGATLPPGRAVYQMWARVTATVALMACARRCTRSGAGGIRG
jgi:hypothetical protein